MDPVFFRLVFRSCMDDVVLLLMHATVANPRTIVNIIMLLRKTVIFFISHKKFVAPVDF